MDKPIPVYLDKLGRKVTIQKILTLGGKGMYWVVVQYRAGITRSNDWYGYRYLKDALDELGKRAKRNQWREVK